VEEVLIATIHVWMLLIIQTSRAIWEAGQNAVLFEKRQLKSIS